MSKEFSMNKRTLHVRVGEGADSALTRAASAMSALDQGRTPASHFEVGFEDVSQMFAVFTPRRWELLAALRKAGPISISALAKLLKRDYKNVHGDVTALMEWLAVDKNEQGLVYAPYADIKVDVHLPDRQAA
jgi:predicted transcriptional regulator